MFELLKSWTLTNMVHLDEKLKMEALVSLYELGFLLSVNSENVQALKYLLADAKTMVADSEHTDDIFLKPKINNNKALIRVKFANFCWPWWW